MPSRFFGWMIGGKDKVVGNSIFPVHLVAGDNGQVGVDLYNFFMQNFTTNEYGERSYTFSADQLCTLNDHVFEAMYISAYSSTGYIKFTPIPSGFLSLDLMPNGYLYQVRD